MNNTAFLSTFFPTLSLTELHFLSMEDLEFALEQNLSKHALRAVNQVWLLGDVENVRSYIRNQPMSKKGSLKPQDIIAIFSMEQKPPRWLKRFLKDFPQEEQRLSNEQFLSQYCLTYAPQEALHPSIAALLTLEKRMRTILERLRKEALNIPQTEPEEWIKDPDSWSEEYHSLPHIWQKNKSNPLALEQELAEWKFSVIDQMRDSASPFSLDRLIFSIALFDFIESRRPLKDETKKAPQERIIQALCHDKS